jgi:arylsulfatase A-like enzyme
MATALTGLLPWHHGAQSRDDRLPESARTLAELFAEQGYATALVTANPNVGSVFGFRQAFEEVSELYARSKPGLVGGRELVTPSDVVTRQVARWLETAREPFFVVVLSIDPHYPYRPPRRFDPARHRGASSGGETPAAAAGGGRNVARERELYQGEVAFNDESFGALVRTMQGLGVWDDTLVVVTADHGEEFFEYGRGGHGKSLTEEVLRVPLIVRRPSDPRLPPGARVERPISLVDLAPTLLDLAGIPAPEGLDGRSWLESAAAPPRPVLAGLDLDGHRLFAVVDPPYKLVWDVETGDRRLYVLRGPSPEARPVDPATDPEAAAAVERLTAALEESLAAADRTLERSAAGELPEDVERSLRALGYLE